MVGTKQKPSNPGSGTQKEPKEKIRIAVTPSTRGVRFRVEVYDDNRHLGGHESFDVVKESDWKKLRTSVETGVRRVTGKGFDEKRFAYWFEDTVRPEVEAGVIEVRKKQHEDPVEDQPTRSPIDTLVEAIETDESLELWCDGKNDLQAYFTSGQDSKEPK